MTTKQINTLKLFAMGYSLDKIAQKLCVSKSTIRSRLKVLKPTTAFDNACGIRACYKRLKYNLLNPISIEDLWYELEDKDKDKRIGLYSMYIYLYKKRDEYNEI